MIDSTLVWTAAGTVGTAIGAAGSIVCYRYARRQTTPVVKVQIGVSFMTLGWLLGPSLLTIAAANAGQSSVTIVSHSLLLPGSLFMPMIPPFADCDHSLPCQLGPGQGCHAYIAIRHLVRSLQQRGYSGVIKLIAQCVDATGKRYNSQPFEFDVQAWGSHQD